MSARSLDTCIVQPEDIDLSHRANPFGPPALAVAALSTLLERRPSALRLPPPDPAPFVHAWAQLMDVHPGHLVPGRRRDLLTALGEMLAGEDVALLVPESRDLSAAFRGAVRVGPPPGLRDTAERRAERLAAAIAHHRVVVLSNPGMEGGHLLHGDLLAQLARAHPHTLLILDEDAAPLVPGHSLVGLDGLSAVVVQSTTTAWGVDGPGVAWTPHAPLREQLTLRLPHHPLSTPEMVMGTAAVADEVWLRHAIDALEIRKKVLAKILIRRFGPDADTGSVLHWRVLHHCDPAAVHTHLLTHGIRVRLLPELGGLRVGVPRGEDADALGRALDALPESVQRPAPEAAHAYWRERGPLP